MNLVDGYPALREQALDCIRAISCLADDRGSTLELARLQETAQKLNEGRFNLVILGQFKRGKSTLINALLGERLLPAAVVPLTSIVTVVEHGSSGQAEVFYTDGRRQLVDVADLPQYVTESGNPRNCLGVARVVVRHPSHWLREGIRLVDTPGIGSVYQHNTESAYDYLPSADAAVFVVGADPPITEVEREFLQAIGRYAAKIFVVQNKVDQVADSEMEESLVFTRQVVEGQLGRNGVVVFPLSAKLALDARLAGDSDRLRASRLPDFECALRDFLVREKGRLLLDSAVARTLDVAGALRLRLELEVNSLNTPLEELERKIALLDDALTALAHRADEVRVLLRARTDQLVNRTLVERIAAFQREQLPVLMTELEQHARDRHHLGASGFRESLQEWVNRAIRATFDAWLASEEGRLLAEVRALLGGFSREMEEMARQAAGISAELFNTPLPSFTVARPTSTVDEFTFKLEDDPTTLHLATGFLVSRMPRSLAHRLLLQDARSRLAELFDRHCGRGRYALAEKIKAVVEHYREEHESRTLMVIEGMRAAVRRGLEAKQRGEERMEQEMALLVRQLSSLSSTQERLEALKSQLQSGREGNDVES